MNLEAILSTVVLSTNDAETIIQVEAELGGSGSTNLVMMAMDNN